MNDVENILIAADRKVTDEDIDTACQKLASSLKKKALIARKMESLREQEREIVTELSLAKEGIRSFTSLGVLGI